MAAEDPNVTKQVTAGKGKGYH